MFLSAVRSTSKPALSAAASKSPLLSVSHPRSLAFVTMWSGKDRAMPFGVTWSKRMSIHGRIGRGRDRRIEAASGERKHGVDLFPRDVELLNDLVYRGSGFKVVEHSGHGHAGILKHPCADQSARHAFHGGAMGPIESCHVLTLLSS